MQNQPNSLPVVIGGIPITQKIIDALQDLAYFGPEARDVIAETSMLIAANEPDKIGYEPAIFNIHIAVYNLLNALNDQTGKEGT